MGEPTLDYYRKSPPRPAGATVRARIGSTGSVGFLGLFLVSVVVREAMGSGHLNDLYTVQSVIHSAHPALLLLPIGAAFGVYGLRASRWVVGWRGLKHAGLSLI